MRKYVLFLGFFLLSGWNNAISGIPSGFVYQSTHFNVSSDAPPVLVYVEDSQGRRTGADPMLSVSDEGMQGSDLFSGLTEIPLSQVIQHTPENPENPSQASPGTGWNIDIYDGGARTYVIHVKGISEGMATILLTGISRSKNVAKGKFDVLVNNDAEREIFVSYNPALRKIRFRREVSESDLLADVKIACRQRLLFFHSCKILKEKAEDIEKALSRNHDRLAKKLLEDFLDVLKKLDRHGQDDAVITILREDAMALLDDIDDSIHHHKRWDKKKFRFDRGWKDWR